ncbi:ATP-binding cassette domain-containing protein [Gordonia sp. NPDC003585]|uniref:ATP-binding cassette domain-containing protein n=1 Tax=Gordonia sp. NPDC003585 TaxID=3154275 RepID=UPI0033BF14D3
MSLVVVEDLAKSYRDVRALDGISFEIPEGSVLGLLGPNGCGKTTTVSILSTLQRPTVGRCSVAGYDVVDDAGRVRELISLTGQYAALEGSLTTRENIAMFGRLTGLPRRETRSRLEEVAETFGLVEFMDRKVSELSGGMRRRVDIAAALVTRPKVLFLDEPTTGLDPRSRASVWETVSTLRTEGITVLLTTQYLEEADRLADDLVLLDHGRVVEQGTPEQLKQRAGSAVCEITLLDSADLDRTRTALREFEEIEAATGGGAQRPRLSVAAPDELGTVGTVVATLQRASIPVFDIALRRPSLDEVFFQLTGQTPESADESESGDAVMAGKGAE